MMDKFWTVGWCESQFCAELERLPSGRFQVPPQTRKPVAQLSFPGSRFIALKRYESLERKLTSNTALRDAYCDFMSEYFTLGHMSVATTPGQYIIPHHAVCTQSNGDFKIRVVFDASAGTSLNSCLFQGPKLQQDLVDILTRCDFMSEYFTTDICKMYRQVLVAPKYRPLQHILWRASPHDKLVEYELNTVTYGLNCAPFLALRVLAVIAENDCAGQDGVRRALLQQTYVGDIKKWSINCPAVLDYIVPSSARVSVPLPFDAVDGSGVKFLGLQWQPTDDIFGCALRCDSPPARIH